jgi:type III secretion system YseE family protein
MAEASIRLLDIEDRLSDDAGGWERDRLLAELRRARADAKRQLDKGVSPEAYRNLNALLEACDAANEIVPQLWRRLRTAAATRG